jgi:hypothetical protein
MKITKKRLMEIIKEELMNESPEGRAQMHAKGLSKDVLRLATYLKKGDIDKARYFMKDIIDSLKEVEKYTRKNDAAYVALKKGPLKFAEGKLNEGKMVQWEIKDRDKRKVSKILDKLRLKMGKNYDFGASRHGATFVLELDKKFEDKVLELFIKNRINVQGA